MAETAIGPGDRNHTGKAHAGGAQPAELGFHTMAAIERATVDLWDVAYSLDEVAVHYPSRVRGWTRAHVLSHLARHADGCVNLLIWAKTGVEHAMYASPADRDADIDEGAMRGRRLLLEDLAASAERLASAGRTMPASAWSTEVVSESGATMPAYEVPRYRLLKIWAHLVDLDNGVGFDDIPVSEELIEDAVRLIRDRPDVPAVTISVIFQDHQPAWPLGDTTSAPSWVQGPPGPILGWLLGRTEGEHLTGDVPKLPVWL